MIPNQWKIFKGVFGPPVPSMIWMELGDDGQYRWALVDMGRAGGYRWNGCGKRAGVGGGIWHIFEWKRRVDLEKWQ